MEPDETVTAEAVETPPVEPVAEAVEPERLPASGDPAESMLLEAVEPEGRVIDVLAIRVGTSKNRRRYGEAVLREAVERGVFNGTRAFASDGPDHDRAKRGVKALVGWWDNARFGTFPLPAGGTATGVAAHFHPTDPTLRATLREAIAQGRHDLIGFSIFGDGPVSRLPDGVLNVDRIDVVESIDPVIHPAAGGQALRLVASTEGTMNCEKCGGTLAEGHVCAITAPAPDVSGLVEAALAPFRTERFVEAEIMSRPGLPEPTKKRIRELAAGQVLDAAGAAALVEAEASYVAAFAPAVVRDAGTTIEPGKSEEERLTEAIYNTLAGKADGVPSDSIRGMYVDLTGDRSFTGRLQEGGRLTESLTTSSFTKILGDSITRRMLDYYAAPGLDAWRNIATTGRLADFRTQRRIRYGGYGNLPTVNQAAAYTALTSPSDEEATYAPAKRGGTEDLTFEMIVNDDLGAIRDLPRRLGRAAAQTLHEFVWDFLATNGNIYTGTALALAGQNNIGTAALAGPSLAAGRLAMKKQADMSNSKRLGIVPSFLVVPVDLEQTAYELTATDREVASGNNTLNFIKTFGLRVIVVDYWTDTNNWWLVADPASVPTIEVGFLNGQESPEIFVQDQPTSGNVFSNDKITFKVRHVYGGAVLDYRGFYGAIVP